MFLTEATALLDNHVSAYYHTGDTLFAAGGTTIYSLPAPAGRWIAGAACRVERAGCPYKRLNGSRNILQEDHECAATRDECALITSTTAAVGGTSCQPLLSPLLQPCDWEIRPDLIGRTFQTLPLGETLAIDVNYPYVCAGAVGGDLRGDQAYQSSPQCAGVCPAGYCTPPLIVPH